MQPKIHLKHPEFWVLSACTHVHTNVPGFARHSKGSKCFGQLFTVIRLLRRLKQAGESRTSWHKSKPKQEFAIVHLLSNYKDLSIFKYSS